MSRYILRLVNGLFWECATDEVLPTYSRNCASIVCRIKPQAVERIFITSLFSFASACQSLLDNVVNRFELFDPFGFQPEKFGTLNPARLIAYFFLGNIFPERVIQSARLLVRVEPRRLSLPRQKPVDGNLGGAGMGSAVE